MKKANRKLIPAVAMLLVSAIMLSTASFAWFSINKEVTATGMTIKANNTANLLIEKGHITTMTAMKNSSIELTATGTIKPTHITNVSGTLHANVPEAYKEASEPDFTNPGVANGFTSKGTTTIADTTFAGVNEYVVAEAMTIAKDVPGGKQTGHSQINAVVTIKFGESKELNGAIRCGFLIGETFTECEDQNTITGNKAITFTNLLSLTDNTPTAINFFVWYEGEDSQCTAASAINLSAGNSVEIVFTDVTP